MVIAAPSILKIKGNSIYTTWSQAVNCMALYSLRSISMQQSRLLLWSQSVSKVLPTLPSATLSTSSHQLSRLRDTRALPAAGQREPATESTHRLSCLADPSRQKQSRGLSGGGGQEAEEDAQRSQAEQGGEHWPDAGRCPAKAPSPSGRPWLGWLCARREGHRDVLLLPRSCPFHCLRCPCLGLGQDPLQQGQRPQEPARAQQKGLTALLCSARAPPAGPSATTPLGQTA